jgi:hypothetical protein
VPARPPACRCPQISAKVDELLRLLAACPDEASKTLTCLTLATRMVSQCDSQVRPGAGPRAGWPRSLARRMGLALPGSHLTLVCLCCRRATLGLPNPKTVPEQVHWHPFTPIGQGFRPRTREASEPFSGRATGARPA